MSDPVGSVRVWVAYAIEQIGISDEDVIWGLIAALQDSEWFVRSRVATGLGKVGARSQEAQLALKNALEDSNQAVRKNAEMALQKINHDPKTE